MAAEAEAAAAAEAAAKAAADAAALAGDGAAVPPNSRVIVDHQTALFVPQHAFPDSDPTDAVLYMAQLSKALTDITDINLRKVAKDELKFFKMAVAIIAHDDDAADDAKEREYFSAIRAQFGNGIEGVKRLALALKEIAMKEMAQEIIKKTTEKAKITSEDGKTLAGSVSSQLKGGGPFHY